MRATRNLANNHNRLQTANYHDDRTLPVGYQYLCCWTRCRLPWDYIKLHLSQPFDPFEPTQHEPNNNKNHVE